MMRRPRKFGLRESPCVQNLDTRASRFNGAGLSPEAIDRWAIPLLSLLGGLGLAYGSIYLDSLRRSRQAQPAREESMPRGRLVEIALVLIALGWMAHHAARRFGGWLALVGYGSMAAGIAVLALYVRRGAAPEGSGPAGT